MRIEVTIGSGEPVSYSLNEGKTLIGSGDNCNINLPADTGISRKHLEVKIEGDKAYVTDLGSSNGTFMNEDRLVPGSKKEFTSFFPVRLADDVYLSLITDDDAGEAKGNLIIPAPTEKKVTPLNIGLELSPKKSNAEKTALKSKINKREQTQIMKGPKKVKNDSDSKMASTKVIVGLIICGALGYQYYQSSGSRVQVAAPVATAEPQIAKPKVNVAPEKAAAETALIPASEIPPLSTFDKAFEEIKCATTLEKKLCESIPDSLAFPGGAVESIDNVIVMVPEKKWYRPVQEVLPIADFNVLSQAIGASFLKSAQIDPLITPKNLFIVFYRMIDSTPVSATVIGIRPAEIEKLQKVVPSDLVKEFNLRGTRNLPEYAKFFTIIQATSKPELEPNGPKKPFAVTEETMARPGPPPEIWANRRPPPPRPIQNREIPEPEVQMNVPQPPPRPTMPVMPNMPPRRVPTQPASPAMEGTQGMQGMPGSANQRPNSRGFSP